MNFAQAEQVGIECERLKRVYPATVELLFSVGYMATNAEYSGLKKSVEEARRDLEAARLELGYLEQVGI